MKSYNSKIKFKIKYDTLYDKYCLCVFNEDRKEWKVLDRSYFIFILKLIARVYAWIYKCQKKTEEFEL